MASDGGRVAGWGGWLGGRTPTLSQRTPATTAAMSGLRKTPTTNQLSDDGADANDCRHATILRRGEDVGRRAVPVRPTQLFSLSDVFSLRNIFLRRVMYENKLLKISPSFFKRIFFQHCPSPSAGKISLKKNRDVAQCENE